MLVNYPGLEALAAHVASDVILTPPIVEIEGCAEYERHAQACIHAGRRPMLQYFGDDPAVFREIVALKPPMLNLNRGDLFLAALRSAEVEVGA